MSTAAAPRISILVCAYNMARELPRTLYTLSAAYQRDAQELDWEVVVLDNGSNSPVDEGALQEILPGVRVVRPDDPKPSPAAAINAAMAELKGQLIGLFIDGARLASPGIIRHAADAWLADPSRAIGTLAFHLGNDGQHRTVHEGYNAATEDALLASVPWEADGYRLFDIASLAGSSANGWFGCINETNGLFMDRAMWPRVGGLDERFESPGGGFVNLELWERAVAASNGGPWIMLGEGTFHQVHGGVATNGPPENRDPMRAEYAAIHGRPFAGPKYRPQFVGALDDKRFAAGAARPLDRQRRVHSVRQRHFRVDLPTEALNRIQHGTLRTRYKGLRLAKSPFDLALYMQAIERLRPATIIEVGTSEGGSAAWLIDQCRAFGLSETQLISIDIAPPELELQDVSFHQGDSSKPRDTFPHALIDAAPHPWLVIEDSAHSYESARAMLGYFDEKLRLGDLFVLEDGVLADLEGEVYRGLEDGPNRALAEFLRRTGDRYNIDTELCDFYGRNLTYAPNGWLRRG
jgi:cephalosporin hydroxylase